MKKYLKMTGYILALLSIITICAIASKSFFKSYADTPTKEVTVSKVTYEFEAEDIDAKTGNAHNLRIKSYSDSSKSLTIPDDFTLDGRKYSVDSIGNGEKSALGNTDWNSIAIEKGILTINAHAFEGCTSLELFSFKKDSKCTTIGNRAFAGCTALTQIRSANTDYTCSDAECTPTSGSAHSKDNCGGTITDRRYKLPSKITTIGEEAFMGCTSLERVVQNSKLTSIGDRAFLGCTSIDGYNSKGERQKSMQYCKNGNLKVGKDAYRFGGYPTEFSEIPTININQSVDKADVEYYTNGIGKVTMNISSESKQLVRPKDYIVCLDTTGSMYQEGHRGVITVKDANGNLKTTTKLEVAKEALQLLADTIYAENPKNRLAIVTSPSSSYLYMDWRDGSESETVKKAISEIAPDNRKGSKTYGSTSSYYSGNPTNYDTGLKTMADVIMGRKTERDRNVYGIFISDGFATKPDSSKSRAQAIISAAQHLQGACDAVWSVGIALEIGDVEEEIDPDDVGEDDDGEFDEDFTPPAIDPNDKAAYLRYIRTYWGKKELILSFPSDENLQEKFNAFMKDVVDISTASLTGIKLASKLNTDIWEFYTGTEYANSEGCDITDSQNAIFNFDRVGNKKQEQYYYIRLKDNKRDKTDPQLLVSNELTAEYTISGGGYNGESYNKENGKNALYDTPLYLDWKAGGDPTPPPDQPDPPPDQPDPPPDQPDPPDDPTPPGPGETLRPGKLEITKTGEALIDTEENANGVIIPVYEEVKVKGAEFEVYAKEDIYVTVNKGDIATQADEGTPENPGETGTPENPGETGTPENPGETGTPENPGDTETKLLYAKDILIKKIVTDENGKAELENLPAGKYYIKEVKAGEGFILNKDIKEFEIVDQGEDKTIQKVAIAYKNERQKVNINGKEGLIVEKTADKKIYKPGEEIIYTIRVTNTMKNVIKDIKVTETMIEGKFEDISTDIITKENDKTIGIKELKPGETVELKFIANIASPAEKEEIVNIVKATGKTEEPNPEDPENPIVKDIEGEDDEKIYIATKELVIVKEALKDEYEVGETVQYVIRVLNNGLTDITDVVVEEKMLNGKFVYVEEANQGGVDIKLVGDQKVTISKLEPGKMITLKYEYEITKDTKVILDDEKRIILGNKVTVKGKIEPQTPTPQPTPVEIEDEDTEEIEIKPNSEGNGLGIIKKDLETGKTIQGAVIGLYAAENITGSNEEIVIAKDTLIEKVTTNEYGRAKYTVDLPLGRYYIKEIEAPEKYMLSEEKIEINATYKGQEIAAINVDKVLTNRKTVLDFSIDKTLSSISVDGENIPIKDNKLAKLEIKTSNIKKANIIANYKIKVKNKVNMAGKVKVLEIVPKGYEVVNAPEYWTARPDGILETEVSLEGNESKELDISLKWINDETNLGSGTNKAKLETDDDTNTDDDDSQATIIVSVKTGEIVSAIIIIMIIASLGICGYITAHVVSKMGKGPDIEGIKFLKNKNK